MSSYSEDGVLLYTIKALLLNHSIQCIWRSTVISLCIAKEAIAIMNRYSVPAQFSTCIVNNLKILTCPERFFFNIHKRLRNVKIFQSICRQKSRALNACYTFRYCNLTQTGTSAEGMVANRTQTPIQFYRSQRCTPFKGDAIQNRHLCRNFHCLQCRTIFKCRSSNR